MTETTTPHTIVLGAGPVGLAAALLLAAHGHRVDVYEARDELDLSDADSYPIGVNPRGQQTLRKIDPTLLEALRAQGEVVEAFNIYAGRRRVATLASGTLIGTTRAFLTGLLHERASAVDAITLHLGHKLTGLDIAARTLTFRVGSDDITVDARQARVLAADGVRSAARSALEDQVPDFRPRVGDWGVQFRVAYSRPGATAPGLDPAIHHIFTSKGIYTATLRDGVWAVVLTAIDGDDAEELLLSTQGTEADVAALRAHLVEHAPLAEPLLDDDDLAAFFGREPFGGAVVICPRLAFDEWLLLIGDAAHSVLPPTGEGVNSGLEDCRLVAEHAASGSPTWMAEYEAARLPDLHALGEYAWVLKDNLSRQDPAARAANVTLRIIDTVATKLRLPSARVEARLFGPDGGKDPYSVAIGPWLRQRQALYPPLHKGFAGILGIASKVRPAEHQERAVRCADTTGEQMRITVVGGSQGTGRALAELARDQGHDVTVVTRSGVDLAGVRVVTGDAADASVARDAVAGADAVVICVGGSKENPLARTVVTRSVIAAMKELGVDRLVVQTSLGAGDSARQLPALLAAITPIMLAKPLRDHNAQEDAVRESGLRWTIVRPSGLTNKPATGRWKALRHDEPGKVGGRVTRGDVAACILASLADESTVGAQLGVSGD